MKNKNIIKVCVRPDRPGHPHLKLQGKWLGDALRLRPGDAVHIEQINDKLILTKYKYPNQ